LNLDVTITNSKGFDGMFLELKEIVAEESDGEEA
jgi:hypothetical protein